MYVIQEREKPWSDKWIPLTHLRYKTLPEARASLEAMPLLDKKMRRIAEEYTVIRYKTVKE